MLNLAGSRFLYGQLSSLTIISWSSPWTSQDRRCCFAPGPGANLSPPSDSARFLGFGWSGSGFVAWGLANWYIMLQRMGYTVELSEHITNVSRENPLL